MDVSKQLEELKKFKESVMLKMFYSEDKSFLDMKIFNLFFAVIESFIKLMSKIYAVFNIDNIQKNNAALVLDSR